MAQVFVRPRPLAANETKDAPVVYSFDAAGQTVTMSGKHTSFRCMAGVLSPVNAEAFEVAVLPLVHQVTSGATACCFAYGYTNSGKTHSIFGYGDDDGFSLRAVTALFETNQPPPLVQVRFYELYNDKVFDLLNDRAPGFVREDADGTVHVRSETTIGADGSVLTQSLRPEYGETSEEVISIIKKGLARRAAGTSELHEQSSRSHAVLEIEVVTRELAQARREAVHASARVVPLGKARDGLAIATQTKLYVRDADGKYVPSGAVVSQEEEEQLARLEGALREAQRVADEAQERVDSIKAAVSGGTMVFVDLAGAEYTGKGLTRSSTELREARAINTSLLALKECIRAQGAGHKHVPYRNAKLTMLLKRYLTVATGAAIVMVATVSSARDQQSRARETLQYAAVVAQALR